MREFGIDAMLVICNVSEHEQSVTVPLTEGKSYVNSPCPQIIENRNQVGFVV